MSHGVLYVDAFPVPLAPFNSRVQLLPLSYYVFYIAGTTTPATIYTIGDLTITFPTNVVTANSAGVFPAIFLDPTNVYRVLQYDQFNRKIMDVDPYISTITTLGVSELAINIATGQVTITPVTTGGVGAALTLIARRGGVCLNSGATAFSPGVSEVSLANTGTTGAKTATFTASNKPGPAATSPTQWMPITVNGVQYYIPMWL